MNLEWDERVFKDRIEKKSFNIGVSETLIENIIGMVRKIKLLKLDF